MSFREEKKSSSDLLMKVGKKDYATRNAVPGIRVYGEKLVSVNGEEYRVWDPHRSKLAAGFANKLLLSLSPNYVVLYLGASTGTTVSHIADLVPKGFVFAIDSAPRVMRELLQLTKQRSNIAPILANASHPTELASRLSMVDFMYQDIASKDQVRIFVECMKLFLEKNGTAILCLKARSIDVTAKPVVVFERAAKELAAEVTVVQQLLLGAYYPDHCLFVCKHSRVH